MKRKFQGSRWKAGRESSQKVLTCTRYSENVMLFSLGQLSWKKSDGHL